MKYEKAQKKDLPALTKLWQASFGDSEAEIARFWQLFDAIEVFLARDGAPVAMLSALPVTFFDTDGEAHQASYLYAAATAANYRGRGICTELMKFAEKTLRAQGSELLILCPASEKLFEFYGKMGYKTVFFNREYTANAEGKAKIKPIDAAAYQNLRQMQLYADFVSYEEHLLALQTGFYRVETEERICCAAAEKHGTELLIKELLPDDRAAAAALAQHLGCKTVRVRTEGGEKAFGMAKSLAGVPCLEAAYLGLAFD